MKRLVVFCFCLLFGVLSALSILNFDGEAVGAMEGKMSRMMIVKPQGMDNTYFLTAIDNALKDKNADIMMRIVSLEDGKPINRYYKTNHTSDFLDIKTDCGIVITGNECIATVEQEGYTTHRLGYNRSVKPVPCGTLRFIHTTDIFLIQGFQTGFFMQKKSIPQPCPVQYLSLEWMSYWIGALLSMRDTLSGCSALCQPSCLLSA